MHGAMKGALVAQQALRGHSSEVELEPLSGCWTGPLTPRLTS